MSAPARPDLKITLPNSWTLDRIDRLAALRAEGHPPRTIAQMMGLTLGQVTGQCHRLKLAGDPRFQATPRADRRLKPQAGQQAARDRADSDALAELVANGATLNSAAIRLQLTGERADTLWAAIRTGLGPQAC